MQNILGYLKGEQGMAPLSQQPFSQVDALVLSALVYIHFSGLVPEDMRQPVTIKETAQQYLALPKTQRGRCRCKNDLVLLREAAMSPRFAPMRLAFYEDRCSPDEEMQFAAMSILPGDGSIFLAFRGTDATFVGWKEDFNMTFRDVVPAQEAALAYLERVAEHSAGGIRLGGHSKGGNLAVYAAALCSGEIRRRVTDVYDCDGPGFSSAVLEHPGYRELLPRIQKMVPQSSIIGMLLEYESPYTVVKSNGVLLFQHDPYAWQVANGAFISLENVSQSSRIIDGTIKDWVGQFTPEERCLFIDAVYELILDKTQRESSDVIRPRDLYKVITGLRSASGDTRVLIQRAFSQLARSAVEKSGIKRPIIPFRNQ